MTIRYRLNHHPFAALILSPNNPNFLTRVKFRSLRVQKHPNPNEQQNTQMRILTVHPRVMNAITRLIRIARVKNSIVCNEIKALNLAIR